MRLIETDLGKYEEYIYFFIEKNRAYFNAYQEQIFLKDEYNIISKYFRDETQEYAVSWMKFSE
ncbi:hypothetical protein [uncultured Campylobacter sp.]|uniref:hypothetical protein n=1 Tax=uncultured Campylobacter sp. TaxID=218934 RepID=UPI00262CD9C4|nr:hypothetical protein [uncultured Campylobacter sp.]